MNLEFQSLVTRTVSTWKILMANKLRTFLTLLGIVIGISAVIILMSLGDGVKASITTQVTSLGANNITISPGKSFASGAGVTLGEKDITAVQAVADKSGAKVSWQSSANGTVVYDATSATASSIGVSTEYWTVTNIEVATGRTISAEDITNVSRVVVLGDTLKTKLFPNGEVLGQQITINGISFKVIGVLKAGGTGLSNNDNNCIVPISVLQTYLTGKTTVSQITVQVSDKDQVSALKSKLEAFLRVSRGIAEGDDADFQVTSLSSVLDTVNSIISTLTILLSATAAISLLVGGIGIMNIMFVSVTERTKEVGLRKALGANDFDILFQFLIEAVVVTLLGGIIGTILGVIIAIIAATAFGITPVVSPTSILLALFVSATVGIVFGIYPARRASKLTPIDALRFE